MFHIIENAPIIEKVPHYRKSSTLQKRHSKFCIKIKIKIKFLHWSSWFISVFHIIEKAPHYRKVSTLQKRLHNIEMFRYYRKGFTLQKKFHIIGKVPHCRKGSMLLDRLHIIEKAPHYRKHSKFIIETNIKNSILQERFLIKEKALCYSIGYTLWKRHSNFIMETNIKNSSLVLMIHFGPQRVPYRNSIKYVSMGFHILVITEIQ